MSERKAGVIATDIGFNHHLAKCLEGRLRLPPQFGVSLLRIANQQFNLGGTIKLRINLHDSRGDPLEAGSPLCGGRALYPFRLLVHLIDQLRQPGGNDREVPYRHFFRYRARQCCRVHSGSTCRGDSGVAHLPLVDRRGFYRL